MIMTESTITTKGPAIDTSTCDGCAICVEVCPTHIFVTNGNKSVAIHPERADFCMACGHCMAYCPSASISVAGIDPDHIVDLTRSPVDFEALSDLLVSRRSVRVYKDKPVPRELLEQIVSTITLAPMGFTPHKMAITVVDDRTMIEQALPILVDFYEKLGKWLANPFMRRMMKRRVSQSKFEALDGHVMPSMAYRLPMMKATGIDTITRGAPAMLLFHGRYDAAYHYEDSFIALTYGLIAAHALGLGASGISLVPPIVEKSAELRELFQIPPDHEVCSCMVLGYPKLKVKRGIRREMAGVDWL
jgi:nitroreductase/NAD-dependent dihydropyrimidine dehydrogenase PreA subunit